MKLDKKLLGAGIAGAGLLGFGAYLAIPAATSPQSSTRTSAERAAISQSGADQDAMELAAAVADDDTGAPAGAGRRDGRAHPRRLLRLLRAVHGEATVRRDGAFVTVAWQRGQITQVSDRGITVRSADGVTWGWTLTKDTRIRKDGTRTEVSALKTGDRVVVIGPLDGSTRTAKAVIVPRRTTAASPSPSAN